MCILPLFSLQSYYFYNIIIVKMESWSSLIVRFSPLPGTHDGRVVRRRIRHPDLVGGMSILLPGYRRTVQVHAAAVLHRRWATASRRWTISSVTLVIDIDTSVTNLVTRQSTDETHAGARTRWRMHACTIHVQAYAHVHLQRTRFSYPFVPFYWPWHLEFRF